MKQTAVEWLVDNLHYLHSTKWNDIVEQAEEMEKQQMKDAWDTSDTNMRNQFSSSAYKAITFNQWFEQSKNK